MVGVNAHGRVFVTIMMLVAGGLGSASCSTAAEPSEGAPPVCEFCDVGEQQLRCATVTYYDGGVSGSIGDAAYVCLVPTATDQDKEQACLASCEDFIADNESGLECGFEEGEEPFRWVECVPPTEPTGGAAGADQECPGWYAPASRVHGFESEGATVTVTIERGLVEQLRAEPGALYACDDARYVAREEGWVFEGIDPGDLLFELGIREGDRGAVVQGFDPRTGKVTSTGYALTSIEGMQQAYAGLREADGVRVVVERAAGDGGAREVWISIL
ncbi:MAG: hypothetical protein KDK70_38055 [Myxococcales bacterium]|nr:hypothetical protein [Myxococcales bacterium]